MRPGSVSGISSRFRELSQPYRQVAYVLLTRPPLSFFGASTSEAPLDLHVLGTPPAFVLSQDQTLRKSGSACRTEIRLASPFILELIAHFVL